MKEKDLDIQVIINEAIDLRQMPKDILEAFISALEQIISEYYEKRDLNHIN